MILVTGGTGFIGRELVRQLIQLGKPVRTLLKPSTQSPNLPQGVAVEAAVASFNDEKSLRAALKGIDVIFHLAGSERKSSKADLNTVDVRGTQALVRAARDAGVRRIFYMSHLGADRASAYSLFKAKALAEGFITSSGIDYTIFRSGVVFGPGDQFTAPLARLLKVSPGFFLMPGDGSSLIQPVWIKDLVACLILSLEEGFALNEVVTMGGGETIAFRDVLGVMTRTMGISRSLIKFPAPYMRILALVVEQLFPRFPVSLFWLDYLAADRTTALDTMPRMFGLLPARFHQNLGYLTPNPRSFTRKG